MFQKNILPPSSRWEVIHGRGITIHVTIIDSKTEVIAVHKARKLI
jgi:hypothetical protein